MPRRSADIAITVGVGLAGALAVRLVLIRQVGVDPQAGNWWGLDVGEYVAMLRDHLAPEHENSARHPLVSLLVTLPVELLRRAGLSERGAIELFVAGVGGMWCSATYLAGRALDVARVRALLSTALVGASAPFAVYSAAYETFALAGASLAAALALAALAARVGHRGWSAAAAVAAIAVPMSCTTPLAAVGFAVVGLGLGWRSAIRYAVIAYVTVTLLFGLQSSVYEANRFFVGSSGRQYINLTNPGYWVSGPCRWSASMLFVPSASAERIEPAWYSGVWMLLGVATVAALGCVAVGLWRSGERNDRTLLAAIGVVAAQTAAFGYEPFLYTPFGISLVAVSGALATRPVRGQVVVVGTSALVVAMLAWNLHQVATVA